ncbi:MAG: hypothetical protein ABSG26_09880 [Bryobacteraceae bacterium]
MDMQQMLVFFEGIVGYRKLWVTLDPPSSDGTFRGRIHKKQEDVLLGFGQLAREGRMYTLKGGLKVPIIEVTREGEFTARP